MKPKRIHKLASLAFMLMAIYIQSGCSSGNNASNTGSTAAEDEALVWGQGNWDQVNWQ